MNNRKKFICFMLLVILVSLVACSSNETSQNEKQEEYIVTTLLDDYVNEGIETVSPFTIYNEDGSICKTFENMYEAIRVAGINSNSSNKMYVLDNNNLKIFERTSKTNYWCFDGTNFVGMKKRVEAEEWAKARKKAYVIDGQGKSYAICGTNYYEGSDLSQDINLELNAGAYNYMYSTKGVMEGGVWSENGWGYMECVVRLTQTTYMPSSDGDDWNAFIFIYGNAGEHADLGLKGIIKDGEMIWCTFRGCSHQSHKDDPDTYGVSWSDNQEEVVTKMRFDEEKNCYVGTDDLYFQIWQGVDGWILKITNLTTDEVFEIKELHEDMHKDNEMYMQFLLAASYCPVVDNVWNARCGAYLRNVRFEDVKIARYNSNETYSKEMLEDFYPDSNMLYGFSQASDSASMIYGIKDNKKFISFSCYYDGKNHFE